MAYASGMQCFSLQNTPFSQISQQPRLRIGHVAYIFSKTRITHFVFISKGKTPGQLDYTIQDDRVREIAKGTIKIKTHKPDDPIGLVICPKDYTEPGADFYTIAPAGIGWRLAIAIGYTVKVEQPPQRIPPINR
jgi:hypothetical protein